MREMHLAWRGKKLEIEPEKVFVGLKFPLFPGMTFYPGPGVESVYIPPWIRISRSRSTYLGLFSTLTVWHHVFSRLEGSRSGGILLGLDRHCCHLFSRKASVVSIGRAESVSVRCVDQQSGSGDLFG